MVDNPKIQIQIENKQNIELIDLVQMMNSFNDECNRFIKQNNLKNSKGDYRLYVERISEGSIIIDIVGNGLEVLSGITPVLIEYYYYLTSVINYLVGESKIIPDFMRKENFLNFKKFFNVAASFNGNKVGITLFNNANVIINNNYSYKDANTIQNSCEKEIKRLEKCGDGLIREEVELLLYQARDSHLSKSLVGNTGIIKEISNVPKTLSFANEKLQYDLTKSEINPFNFTYIVTVHVKLKEGSDFLKSHKDIKGYEILKLHSVIDNKDMFSEKEDI